MSNPTLTKLPQFRYTSTHELMPGDVVMHYGALLQLVERHERADPNDQGGGSIVNWSTRCLNDGGGIPPQWIDRDGGYRIQGNGFARWAVIESDLKLV